MLEEIGYDYKVTKVDISKDEQFKPEFIKLNSPVISGVGNEPSVVGYAMGIDKELTSSAIIGNSGVFYIFVTDRRKASSLDNYQNMINIKNSLRSSLVRSKVFDALKDKADIEDFRFKFY